MSDYTRLGPFGLALGLITACAAPSLAADLIPVTYGTNWVAQAEHGGFYQAVADGTYKACGLDVTIVPGGPQVNNQALMLAGKLDFYMGGTLDAMFGAQQGLPLVNVAAMFQKEPQVILTHPGKIPDFQSMKGLTTIFTADGAAYWEWMKSAYGFTDEQRKPYTFNSAPFIADENSAMQGYLTSEPFSVEKEAGWKPDVWLLADQGYTSYSTTIQATKDTVEKKPDVVKCFVDGSITGWYNYLYNDNKAANAAIIAANPDMTQESIDYAISKLKSEGIVDSGDSLTMGIGAMTDARMKDFYAKMVKAGVIPDGVDISQSYTTAFVDKGVGLDLKPK